MGERYDVVIVGAGQAGLSMGHYLSQLNCRYLIIDKAPFIASAWRSRWDSFTLVTPNWSLNLPEFPYEKVKSNPSPDSFLSREEVVSYLEEFASAYSPPLRLGVRVDAVNQQPDGAGYVLETSEGAIESDNVVVATSTYQEPKIPAYARDLASGIDQVHTSEYRNPDVLKPGAVLVVGTGQSGCQIAEELYQSGRNVYLCVGSSGRAPRRYRGRDTTWWMNQMGLFDQPVDKLPSPQNRFASSIHVSGKGGGRTLNLHQFARDGVTLLGHMTGVQGSSITAAPDMKDSLKAVDQFAEDLLTGIDNFIEKSGLPAEGGPTRMDLDDGYKAEVITKLDLEAEDIKTVIWATGYKFDFSWVNVPLLDDYGYPYHERGVTEYPGLYFLGLVWLHNIKSSLLAGVGDDAAYLASIIADRLNIQ